MKNFLDLSRAFGAAQSALETAIESIDTIFDKMFNGYGEGESAVEGLLAKLDTMIDNLTSIAGHVHPVGDYVIENGTTTTTLSAGGTQTWNYRKWNSGVLEAWTEIRYTALDCSTAYGQVFKTTDISESFPTMFIYDANELNKIYINKSSGVSSWIGLTTGRNDENKLLPPFYFTRGTSHNNLTEAVDIYIIGKWK